MTASSILDRLNDRGAKVVLTTFASVWQETGDFVTIPRPDLLAVLRKSFPDIPSDEPVSEEDMVRAALELLIADDEHAPSVMAMAARPPPERFGVIGTASVVAAVLVALQTHVRIERKSGEWTVLVENKPTDPSLLARLVSRFFGFLKDA